MLFVLLSSFLVGLGGGGSLALFGVLIMAIHRYRAGPAGSPCE